LTLSWPTIDVWCLNFCGLP